MFPIVVLIVVSVIAVAVVVIHNRINIPIQVSGRNNRQVTSQHYKAFWQAHDSPAISSSSSHHHLRTSINHRSSSSATTKAPTFDAIVVGSGLAGLTTTLELLDRGGIVALVEKEINLGGNSMKASSGINGCCDESSMAADTLEAFELDTMKSAGSLARPALVQELVSSSASALDWLRHRVGMDLTQVAQLGGHSFARTHRPATGMVGAELIVHLEQVIRTYEESKKVTVLTQHSVVQLLNPHGGMDGVLVRHVPDNTTITLYAPHVVLATGGFASDRRSNSLLQQVRPDLVEFGTTGGSFSTGDGIALGTSVGGKTVDLDQIQLHPTGFVDPLQPDEPTKVLAAELLRGVGGILLHQGRRFCNELGTRDYVTQQMLAKKSSNNNDRNPTFALVLTEEAAKHADKHVALYLRKGLMTKLHGLAELAQVMQVPFEILQQTFHQYNDSMTIGHDSFGKTVFKGLPADWNNATYYVGIVTPVLHYCMGGLSINTMGQVLDDQGTPVPGLYAAGEVAGGVHGQNRLGGNSLLECTVFGRKIGQSLPVAHERDADSVMDPNHLPHGDQSEKTREQHVPIISRHELTTRKSRDELWMAVHGLVYNLTEFAPRHPGGAAILESLAGTDATEAFDTVHSTQLLPGSMVVARLDPHDGLVAHRDSVSRIIQLSELKQHARVDDCWVVFHGTVYDMTEFSKTHKGGAYLIQKYAGKDATDTFKVFHKKDKLALVAQYRVGTLATDTSL